MHYPKLISIDQVDPSIFTKGELFWKETDVQEKIDGSQFSFGKNDQGELFCNSKKCKIAIFETILLIKNKNHARTKSRIKRSDARGSFGGRRIFRGGRQ